MNNVNIAILGASGYTGAELIRLLRTHPHASIKVLTANAHAGKPLAEVFPHLGDVDLPDLTRIEDVDFTSIDVVFCCLPHATSQPVIRDLPTHLKIIDLSADFRLRDSALYEQWYDKPHQAETLQQEAIYGLTEQYRDQIKLARLVANPGCYPTCSLLPLLPLVKAGLIAKDHIIIDAKSGVTGAGRSVKQNLLFNEVSEGTSPYAVNHHRHIAELQQELGTDTITFVPHLLPQRRGMIASLYVTSQDADIISLRTALEQAYEAEPFTQILEEGVMPTTHSVRGANHCHINLFKGTTDKQAILISTIDNLMKGASGQALHNMNLMFGFPETLGLNGGVVFP